MLNFCLDAIGRVLYKVFCSVAGLMIAFAIILSSKRGRWKWFQAMMGG